MIGISVRRKRDFVSITTTKTESLLQVLTRAHSRTIKLGDAALNERSPPDSNSLTLEQFPMYI